MVLKLGQIRVANALAERRRKNLFSRQRKGDAATAVLLAGGVVLETDEDSLATDGANPRIGRGWRDGEDVGERDHVVSNFPAR